MDQLLKFINVQHSARKLLSNKKYHLSKTSIPKEELTVEKEPEIRDKLSKYAKLIVENSNFILNDVYEDDERTKDWNSLLDKEVVRGGEILAIDTRSRPGHKIIDHHMRHFYDVKNHKGVSVRSLITQENVEKALITNLSLHSTPYVSEIRRMIVMTGGLGNVTKYRTVTSKAIVQYFGAKRVLDPCCGWGGRMLGSISAGAEYVGCEPDPNTAAGLRNILNDPALNIQEGRAIILEKPAEVGLEQIKKVKRFDLVLTSPPYYNLEIYTDGEQSIHNKSWEEWVDKWLKVVILDCLSCLKEGGVSCWSVKNFKSDKKYALADETKKIHKDAGWTLVKTVIMKGSGRPGAKRIEGGKEKRESEEETFCFRRGPV
jgi:16S rRNA G966 N2-methylase RsmD